MKTFFNQLVRSTRRKALVAYFVVMVASVAVSPLASPSTVLPRQDLWFPVGESIRYKVCWGFIPVAETHVTSEWIKEDGRDLIAIRFITKSNSYLNKIYPVDDFIESIVEPDTFLPIRFTKRLREGRYRCHEVTTFDRDKLKARWESIRKNKVKEYDIEPDTRDIVSFMYAMRTKKFEEGESKHYRVMSDEKLYDLWVNAREVEKVKSHALGKQPSMKLEPEAAFQGLFVRKGKVTLWISEDDRRVVTKMVADVPFANVKMYLDELTEPARAM